MCFVIGCSHKSIVISDSTLFASRDPGLSSVWTLSFWNSRLYALGLLLVLLTNGYNYQCRRAFSHMTQPLGHLHDTKHKTFVMQYLKQWIIKGCSIKLLKGCVLFEIMCIFSSIWIKIQIIQGRWTRYSLQNLNFINSQNPEYFVNTF